MNSIKQLNNANIQYDGNPAMIAKLWFKNLLLTILTLGFYRFWGLTNLRQYVTSCHQFAGERFVYTGSGDELFYGFFRILHYFIPPVLMIIVGVVYHFDTTLFLILYYIWLSNFFAYGGLQYYLSRTKWQGAHGTLTGNRRTFARKQFFMTIFSFGFLIPYIAIERHEYIMKHFSFAGLKGQFNRVPHKLISRRIYAWLLMLPSLGYSRCWYLRLLNEYIYNNTKIGDLQLNYNATTKDIYFLKLKSLGLFIVSLGLATPWIIDLKNQFNAKHLTFTGTIDVTKLENLTIATDGKFADGAAVTATGSELTFDF